MSKLLMCGVSAYLFFSWSVWGPACGGLVLLVTFWDYLSELAREIAEDQVATWIRRRLRSNVHAPAHPYWTLRAFETGKDQSKARDLDSARPVTLSVLTGAHSHAGFLLVRSVSILE